MNLINKNGKVVEKTDPRIEKSKQNIMDALIYLSGRKDYPDITIKELCAKAGVNRTTFYAHFKNTRDVLNEIEKIALQSRDWYDAINKENRQELITQMKPYKETFSLLLDYGNIRKMLLSKSLEKNRLAMQNAGIVYDEEDLKVANTMAVGGLLEAFRYMIYSDSHFDMDQILDYLVLISENRYKELASDPE